MTVKEIIIKYLKDNGFGGLCNNDEGCCCAMNEMCSLGDSYDCKPAYLRKVADCKTKCEDYENCLGVQETESFKSEDLFCAREL